METVVLRQSWKRQSNKVISCTWWCLWHGWGDGMYMLMFIFAWFSWNVGIVRTKDAPHRGWWLCITYWYWWYCCIACWKQYEILLHCWYWCKGGAVHTKDSYTWYYNQILYVVSSLWGNGCCGTSRTWKCMRKLIKMRMVPVVSRVNNSRWGQDVDISGIGWLGSATWLKKTDTIVSSSKWEWFLLCQE